MIEFISKNELYIKANKIQMIGGYYANDKLNLKKIFFILIQIIPI